jgi:hypothetical protein
MSETKKTDQFKFSFANAMKNKGVQDKLMKEIVNAVKAQPVQISKSLPNKK